MSEKLSKLEAMIRIWARSPYGKLYHGEEFDRCCNLYEKYLTHHGCIVGINMFRDMRHSERCELIARWREDYVTLIHKDGKWFWFERQPGKKLLIEI